MVIKLLNIDGDSSTKIDDSRLYDYPLSEVPDSFVKMHVVHPKMMSLLLSDPFGALVAGLNTVVSLN